VAEFIQRCIFFPIRTGPGKSSGLRASFRVDIRALKAHGKYAGQHAPIQLLLQSLGVLPQRFPGLGIAHGSTDGGGAMAQMMARHLFRHGFPPGSIPVTVDMDVHKAGSHKQSAGIRDLRICRDGKILPNGRMIARYWQIDDRTEGQTDAPIRYTQADVRQLQLAKGAVAAAFRRLCEEAKCVSDEKCSMDCLHIDLHMTGGLGCHIPTSDALDIGLVCDMKSGMTVSFVPNLALEGAVLCLRKEQRQRAADIASRSRELELSGDGRFDELFVSCMRLGEPDDDY